MQSMKQLQDIINQNIKDRLERGLNLDSPDAKMASVQQTKDERKQQTMNEKQTNMLH